MTSQPLGARGIDAWDDDERRGDAANAGSEHARVLTAEAFAALTGVRAERLRTWQRRHAFPPPAADVHGHRGFRAVDAARVVAARQLIESGEPVADAINRVRDQAQPEVDRAALERAFGAAATPVVAISGPAPLQIVWANAAALETAPGSIELPYEFADRSSFWRRLVVEPPTQPLWSAHAPWFAGEVAAADDAPDPVSAVTWAAGAPAFVPAVLVVIDVPVSEETPSRAPRPEERAMRASEYRCALAVGAARRALQRSSGRQGLTDALGALVTSGLCIDAVLLAGRSDELRPALSACGRHEQIRPADHAAGSLRLAIDEDRPVQVIGESLREELGLDEGESGLVAPLVAGGHEYGLLLAITAEPIDVTEDCSALVMALAANLAATMSRNRAMREYRRLGG